jgi:hypothetical protein
MDHNEMEGYVTSCVLVPFLRSLFRDLSKILVPKPFYSHRRTLIEHFD